MTADIADSLGLKDAQGALVDEPQDGSPAAKAGLKSGDVILSVDGQSIKDSRDLALKIAAESPGRAVDLVVVRNGKQRTMNLTVGSYPNSQTAENTQSGEAAPKIGLTLAPAGDVAGAGSRGAVVINVDPDGAAADKGIEPGDVILEIGRQIRFWTSGRQKCFARSEDGQQARNPIATQDSAGRSLRRDFYRRRLS